MMDMAHVHGKRLAMIAWGKKKDGSKDAAVFTGIASWDGSRLTMRREPVESSFVIPDEWLARLKPVEAKLKDTLLGADYSFSVTVGDLAEGDDLSEFVKTGLTWPTDGGSS
jgi:hypothetical protein